MSNTLTAQRQQYVKDCTAISRVLNLQAAFERIYDNKIPKDLSDTIAEKLESFKIEDENEI